MNIILPCKDHLHDTDNAKKHPTFGKEHQNTIFITLNVLKHFPMLSPSPKNWRQRKTKLT